MTELTQKSQVLTQMQSLEHEFDDIAKKLTALGFNNRAQDVERLADNLRRELDRIAHDMHVLSSTLHVASVTADEEPLE
ncbi:MAG: hypothetical protein Tsb005_13470 [Gammaproteobacteria bacterium]